MRLKRTTIALLASTIGIVSVPTIAQAQDVLFRRPIGQKAGPAPTVTPTTSPTCTGTSPDPCLPSTPTPTPTPVTIVDPHVDPADEGYGWRVNCPSTTLCMHLTRDAGSGNIYATQAPGQCPATQSDAANELAHMSGLFGMADGISDGNTNGICSTDGYSGNGSVYLAYVSCDPDTQKNVAQCTRELYTKPYVTGSYGVQYVDMADDSACIAQDPSDPAYQDIKDSWNATDPSQIASQVGKTCSTPTYHNAYGGTCVDPSTGGVNCHYVNWTDNGGVVTITGNSPYQDADRCNSDQGLTSLEKSDLSGMGYLPGSPSFSAACAAPPLYAASGKCVNSVTYDAGWPQTGSAHVDSGFKAQCYAVYGATDPDNIQAVPTDLSNCVSQQPTATQQQELAALAPDLQDYNAIRNTQCTPGEGSNYNYQEKPDNYLDVTDSTGGWPYRAEMPVSTDPDFTFDSADMSSHGGNWALLKGHWNVPYVCTDATPGSYYGQTTVSSQLASTYPITRGDCLPQHQTAFQNAQAKIQAEIANPVNAENGLYCDNGVVTGLLDRDGNPTDLNGKSCEITIEDHPDQSYFTVNIYAIQPIAR